MLPRARYPLALASRRFTTARPTLAAASLHHPGQAPLQDTGPGGHAGGGSGGGSTNTAVWVAGGLVAAAAYLKWGRDKGDAAPKHHHDATAHAHRNRQDTLPLRPTH
ncbi:hypothetical protein JCM3770_001494 [Rhodotorula araucariae]